MVKNCDKIISALKAKANPKKALILSRFFKTNKGEYGEGDIFWGITVPEQREIAKNFLEIDLDKIKKLINSKVHELRLTGFIILTYKYERAKNAEEKKDIYNFYLKYRKQANNWDIIDVTCPKIIGAYLFENKNKTKILYKLAISKNIWERRISILATYPFIKNNQFKNTLEISKILLNDDHDLMHKAVGWMLREVGNKNIIVEEKFLKKHYKKMPRTMLRYAIEKFEETKRQKYLKGKI